MRKTTLPYYQQRGEQALKNTLEYFKKERKNKTIDNDGAYLTTLLQRDAGQDKEITKDNASTTRQQTKVLRIPNMRDGAQLQAWAISNGLPEASVGMDTYQYRQMLHSTLERMRVVEERKQVGD